jgi:SAM-dependent methyltransferase
VTELLDAFAIQWRGLSVLAIAAEADRLAERLRSEGTAAVDTVGATEQLTADHDPRSYDMVIVDDVLYTLPPTAVHDALRWVHDHLRPGGGCLIATRTYLGADGGGLGVRLQTPYAHLAFARDVIDGYYAEHGWQAPPHPNIMCRATYLILLRRVGLVIEEVQIDDEAPQLFADKLQWYDQAELRAGALRAWVRRPSEDEEQRERAELLAALRAS